MPEHCCCILTIVEHTDAHLLGDKETENYHYGIIEINRIEY